MQQRHIVRIDCGKTWNTHHFLELFFKLQLALAATVKLKACQHAVKRGGQWLQWLDLHSRGGLQIAM